MDREHSMVFIFFLLANERAGNFFLLVFYISISFPTSTSPSLHHSAFHRILVTLSCLPCPASSFSTLVRGVFCIFSLSHPHSSFLLSSASLLTPPLSPSQRIVLKPTYSCVLSIFHTYNFFFPPSSLTRRMASLCSFTYLLNLCICNWLKWLRLND